MKPQPKSPTTNTLKQTLTNRLQAQASQSTGESALIVAMAKWMASQSNGPKDKSGIPFVTQRYSGYVG